MPIKIEFLLTDCSYHRQEKDMQEIRDLLSLLHGKPTQIASMSRHVRIAIARDEKSPQDTPIIGMASLIPMRTLSYQKGIIEDVVVLPAYQGQGISRRLMETLIGEAKKLHLTRLELTSHPSRIAANALYQKMGFQKRDTNAYRLEI
jgi:GNAT superfamily N-acetyltransferase